MSYFNKIFALTFLVFFAVTTAEAQRTAPPVSDGVRDSILFQGKALAQIMKASQISIELISAKHRLQGLSGYVTYRRHQTWYTSFYSNVNDSFTIHYTITLGPEMQKATADISSQLRRPVHYELPYIKVRAAVMRDLSSDKTFYQFYENTRFNIALVEKRNSFQAFIFTVTNDTSVVLLGNDYIIDVSKDGQILNRKKLHEELVHIPVSSKDGGAMLGSMHMHTENDSPYISPTDIATIIFNKDRISWDKHMIMSGRYMSVFYLDDETLAITPIPAGTSPVRR